MFSEENRYIRTLEAFCQIQISLKISLVVCSNVYVRLAVSLYL